MKTLEHKDIFVKNAPWCWPDYKVFLWEILFPLQFGGGRVVGCVVCQPVRRGEELEMPMLLIVWPTGRAGVASTGRSCRVWTVKLEPGEWRVSVMQQKQVQPLTPVRLGWANKDSEETSRSYGVSLPRERPVLIIAQISPNITVVIRALPRSR